MALDEVTDSASIDDGRWLHTRRAEGALRALTLVHVLRRRAHEQADRLAFRFLADGETETATLTYGRLDQQARAIAHELASLGVVGRPVLLLFPPGLDFVAGYMGCLYSGAIAVPLPTPHPTRLDRSTARIVAVMKDAEPAAILTTAALSDSMAGLLAASAYAPHCLAADTIPPARGDEWSDPGISGAMTAFLQYTSGSTTDPRGVIVSHDNLMHNLSVIRERFGHTAESQGVIWLPPYHDMGLIGGILQPIFAGFPVTLMSPVAFLQRPIRWLQAISRFRATTSGGPNFAYELCLRKIVPERLAALDLASWEVAFNGAEQIRYETMERFASQFAPCGFRREAVYPCYGLAESTLMASGGHKLTAPVIRRFSSSALRRNHVVHVSADSPDSRMLVGCGKPIEDQRILIVDSETNCECPPDKVGEVWLSGPSVARGYWHRPEESEEAFGARPAERDGGPYLRTGDLGFLDDGDLFITGRLKEMIIIDGANHYPRDIERTVEEQCEAIAPGGAAAFSIDVGSDEQLVIFAEIQSRHPAAADIQAVADEASPALRGITAQIKRAVSEHHDLRVYDVFILKSGRIPRTSSGKIRRYACRQLYLHRLDGGGGRDT